jgi:EAL domain-containing protein (putative c-di-GMP-specific phosphodiesterase class I)
VLVEGIETDAHLALAQELGASYVQGFGLGRPQLLPASFENSLPMSEAPTLAACGR